LREFMPSIRNARYPSMNGPFLVERAIKISSLLNAEVRIQNAEFPVLLLHSYF
jgi:hypothetical protein